MLNTTFFDYFSENFKEKMFFKIKKAEPQDVPQILQMLREFAAFENLTEYCTVTEEKLLTAMFETPSSCVEGLITFDVSETALGLCSFF